MELERGRDTQRREPIRDLNQCVAHISPYSSLMKPSLHVLGSLDLELESGFPLSGLVVVINHFPLSPLCMCLCVILV